MYECLRARIRPSQHSARYPYYAASDSARFRPGNWSIRRNGLASRSILIRRIDETVEDSTLSEFILPVSRAPCRRTVLDRYLDGRYDRLRCSADEVLCDICSRGNTQMDTHAESSAEDQARQRRYVRTAALQSARS